MRRARRSREAPGRPAFEYAGRVSPDEVVALLVASLIAIARWVLWYRRAASRTRLLCPHGSRWALYAGPPLAAGVLLAVLLAFAAHDVRDSAAYTSFYMALGMAWLAIAIAFTPMLGLRPHDDVIERRNRGAGSATLGALLGIMLAFAGANIGDGPGWWVVVFCALLSTGTVYAAWIIVDFLAGTTDLATVDRDPAAGIRLGAFLIGAGGIAGRAVAGDWISARGAIDDWLATAWPVLGLVLLEAVIGRMHHAIARRGPASIVALGALPGAMYLLGAGAYIVSLGWWA